MANWHGYLGIEDLALTTEQRAAILAAFGALGPGASENPAHLLHRRVAIGGDKAIYEALFNEDNLTIANVKQFLANAVGIDPQIIDHTLTQPAYGPMVTYTVASVDRMRFLFFGGLTADWEESRVACGAYMSAYLSQWETEL